MITPNDIKLQLMAALPMYTDEFSTIVDDAVVVVDTGSIKVTSVAHGREEGDVIVVSSATVINPVSSVVFDAVSKTSTITTSFEHDRTSGDNEIGGYNKAVLEGFDDATYNGDDFTIISATRTTMVIAADAAPTGALGNQIEPRSLLYGFATISVVDVDTFTVDLDDDIPDGTVFDTFTYATEHNIFIAADITRAVTKYAQNRNNEPALFIVFGTENASKDRNTRSDAIITATSQNSMQLTYIPEVTLVSFAITKTEHSAATKQQQIYEEIRPALRKAMYGHIFKAEAGESLVSFAAHEVSNGPDRWNTGYYVHDFVYQIPYTISIEQGNTIRRNVSFRDIIVNAKMFDTEGALVSLEVEPPI